MSVSSAMRLLEERHVASVVEALIWSNKMDLLALSNVKGEVSLHRLNWQKVWTLPPPKEGVTVKAMAWRPDGKVIAVAYSNQEVLLVDVENSDVLHSSNIHHDISCLLWSEESEQKESSSPFIIQHEEKSKEFLPKLPSLSRSFGPMNKGGEENAEDCKKVGEQTILNILLIGTHDGYVFLKVFGLFPCGTVNLNKELSCNSCLVLSLELSPTLSNIIIIIACKTSPDDIDYNMGLVMIETPNIADRKKELLYLATKHGYIMSLLSYMSQTMDSIIEAWENILMEMDSKLSSYSNTVGEGAVSADFLDLLMFGTPSEELEVFLLQNLTEKGLKKLGHSIELSYSNIQKLVLKHLQAVGQNVMYHLAELQGMAVCEQHFGSLGLQKRLVVNAMAAASAFMAKATEVQQVIDSSMKNYKAFFRWLYVAILRLSDERIPAEVTKVKQQDLRFIAEFLENFDGSGPKNDALKSNPKVQFNLERLGQYLVDEDLKIMVDPTNKAWTNFVDENLTGIKEYPAIIPRFQKMSLVQQHNFLKSSVEAVFKDPDGIISSKFYLVKAIPLYKIKDPSHLKVSCIINTALSRILLSFLHTETVCEEFHLLDFPSAMKFSETVNYKYSKYVFSSQNKDTPLHKILHLQFFSEDILSILLEQQEENRTAVFVQFPTRLTMEYGILYREGSVLSDVESIRDAVTLLEPHTLRPMDNMVASIFAVSGTRKVAVILSESRRRVRLFEMEVEEEEDDDDAMDATNTTKESDTSQTADASTESNADVADPVVDTVEAADTEVDNKSPAESMEGI